jgi:hypothetical protein
MDQCVMDQTGLVLTMACNLRCRLCSNYSPYYRQPAYYPMDYLREELRRYFSIVTHIKKLMITGGEPFLHPDLPRFLDEVRKYRNQIGVFGIITNGNRLPSEELLQAMKAYGDTFHVLIDHYGPDVSVKAQALSDTLTEHGIANILRIYYGEAAHCGGWVDFGDLTQKKRDQQAAKALFAKCAYPQKYHFAFDLVDGAMYPCSACRRCKELGVADDYDEYINLFDDSLTVDQQREKIANIYRRTSLAACAYCGGLTDDVPRFPTAQQLNQEELACVRNGARQYSEVRAMLAAKGE